MTSIAATAMLRSGILVTATIACVSAAQDVAAQTGDSGSSAQPQRPRRAARLPAQDLTEAILYQYLVGEIAAQRGDGGLATQVFIDLARRTRDPRIARRAVEHAGAANLPSAGLDAARLWVQVDPQSREALPVLISLLVSARRIEEAEPHLARLLALSTTDRPRAFMQLHRMLAAHPDRVAVLALVRRLAEPYRELPEAHFAQAQAAHAANEDAAALDALQRAAGLRSDWSTVVLYEAQILQRKSPADAVARLAQYLERYPAEREVRLAYARQLVGMRRYSDARAQFERLLAEIPENHAEGGEVLFAIGALAHQLKDYIVAEKSMRRLLDQGYRDVNSVRYTLGQIAEDQKDSTRAVEWYESVELGDQYLPARTRVAQSMARRGRVAEARKYLRAAGAASGASMVQIVVAEAQVLRDAERHREAYDLLDEALRKSPDQPELLYDLALTAERVERFDVLENKLRRLITLQPNHAHAHNALGYSLADRRERLPEARKLIERALELSPDDAFIIDSMGWVLFREGDLNGALGWLRRAWSERPDAEIGAHLGEVLWVSGARDEAQSVWERAQREHPENEALQKTIKRLKP